MELHAAAKALVAFGRSTTIPPVSRRPISWLVLILCLAGVVRMVAGSGHSLWADDIFSLIASTGHPVNVATPAGFVPADGDPVSLAHAAPIADIWRNQASDVHPPAYFIALRLWRHVFGDGDFALRGLSVVCSLAAIAALFIAAREAFDDRTALWASLILAIAYGPVVLARDVRQQSMLMMFGCLALAMLTRIERRGVTWPRAIGLTACVWLMAETHYFFVGAGVGMAAYAVLGLRSGKRLAVLGCLSAAAVLFLLASGPFLPRQLELMRTISGWLAEPREGHWLRTLLRILAQPMLQLSQFYRLLWPAALLGAVVLIGPLFLLHRSPRLALWWLWAACVIGVAAASDLVNATAQLAQPRYTILAAPAIAVLLAVMLERLRPRGRMPAAAVLIGLCGWGLVAMNLRAHNWWSQSHRQMADAVVQLGQAGDTLVIAAPPAQRYWCRVTLGLLLHYHPHPDRRLAVMYLPPDPAKLAELPPGRLVLITPVGLDVRAITGARRRACSIPFRDLCDVSAFD